MFLSLGTKTIVYFLAFFAVQPVAPQARAAIARYRQSRRVMIVLEVRLRLAREVFYTIPGPLPRPRSAWHASRSSPPRRRRRRPDRFLALGTDLHADAGSAGDGPDRGGRGAS